MPQIADEIDLTKLRCLVSRFEWQAPRTHALEQKIKIGAGFHNKWYGSQKEHWLGWLSLKSRENEIDGKLFTPRKIWSGLKCSPMMFWLAESVGAEQDMLEALERVSIQAAEVSPKDGHPHGIGFRKLLPWTHLENLLLDVTMPDDESAAIKMGDTALNKLIGHLPKYRRYLPE